ncbi:hypothetical protein [Herbaspirillum sp. RV1423]|uniref:hypothetical protein n=1 Tax=Herbaspirillum sp. RV1423 TaxID=1443993 RepID=UPI0012DF6DD6|nr:hypothetical protein [Herbaspirillum sp. RV1423]
MKALVLLLPVLAHAQVVQVKGVGTTSYTAELSQAVKEKAYQIAQVAAVERYFAENGEAESQNFDSIQDKIESNLDKFILSTTVLSEQDQSSLKKYSVAVRVELNVAKLRNTLRSSSAVSKAGNSEKSQLVYLFMGREVSSVRSFDARVVKRIEASGKVQETNNRTTRGSEGESISDTSIGTSASRKSTQNLSSNASMKVEAGGSTTQKADDVSYRLLPMSNVKTAITSVFSQGGFNVAEPEFVLSDKDFKSVNQDYSAGSDLAPPTLRAVVMSLKKSQVPLLVLATLDVGAPAQDPATGMQRVAVTVTGRVLDVSGNLPREVASVPAVQYFGIGPDNATAMNKGLKDAALAAAREVASRLNASGVR